MSEPKSLGRAIADGDIEAIKQAVALDPPTRARLNRALVRQACGRDVNGAQELPPLPKDVRLKVIQCLLDAGADIDNEDAGSYLTVMHVAVMESDLELMDLLLERGSRIHLPHPARMGEIPVLPFAALCGSDRAVFERLLAAGADPDQSDSMGHNAVAFAVSAKNLAMLDDLLAWGSDINFRDSYGRTPLLQNFGTMEPALLLGLIDRGADLRAMDGKGNDAFDYACMHDCPAAATIESLRQSTALQAQTPPAGAVPRNRL